MENEYSVITAHSMYGGDIKIEINYEFTTENELTFVAMNQNGVCEKVSPTSWEENTATIKNPFDCKVWNVMVFRWSNINTSLDLKETDDGDFTTESIKNQFDFMVKVVKEQQEALKKTLLLADISNQYLPNKITRKGKVLSFDDDGNPVCEVEADDVKKIKTYRDEASTSASSASKSATSASNSATSASNSANQAQTSANQAQTLVKKALEIVDPEGFRRDTSANITDLQLFKANTGALHFNGSGYAQCPKLFSNQQFSFAVRIKANKNDVLTGKQVNIIDTGVFYLYIHSSVQRLSVYASGNSLKSVTVEQNDRIFDGNWHSLFVTYDGIMLTLLDEFGVLLSADYSIQEQTIDTQIGTNFVGEMSDVCLFNFDITSADALYTIADYQNGKPIPPSLLLGGGNRFNIVGAVQGTDYKVSGFNCTGSFIEENGVYTIGKGTITEGQTNIQSYLLLKLSSTIKAGSKVKINLKRSGTDSIYLIRLTAEALKIQTTSATAPDYLTISGSSWNGDDLVNNTLVATIDCNGIYLQLGNSYETFSFTEFSIEVNGAILALEDYTINGKVLDYSGNKNHATITGNVMGDNDTRIEAFVEEITTSTSEQN